METLEILENLGEATRAAFPHRLAFNCFDSSHSCQQQLKSAADHIASTATCLSVRQLLGQMIGCTTCFGTLEGETSLSPASSAFVPLPCTDSVQKLLTASIRERWRNAPHGVEVWGLSVAPKGTSHGSNHTTGNV